MSTQSTEKTERGKSKSGLTAALFVAAVGIGAATYYLAKKSKTADQETGRVDKLLDDCDRAAQALEERLVESDIIRTA